MPSEGSQSVWAYHGDPSLTQSKAVDTFQLVELCGLYGQAVEW